ncbi:MAG: aminotransferase class I/II-fold pyridoxal phosphate-dependent enzyme [Deltaproteobacteria bacterium]|nr:aminotransferase class I/II-fold pyridoxal phosphate-dependent enzyme [Nannocystaceae bacterium]
MSSLSRRAHELLDAPALAGYLLEHFGRVGEAWDASTRPDGYIALCVAENKLLAEDLAALLAGYARNVPATVLGYDAMIGNLGFREALAGFMGRAFLGRTIEAGQLAVVAGAGAVLELLFYALADDGDGVLVPTPSYAGFWPDLQLRDRLRIVPVHCSSATGFTLTTADLDAAMDGAEVPVKALLFTTPNNPTGRVYSREELLEILAWGERRGLHVVFDEIYALSVFGERPFVSAASLRPVLGERAHIVWAFSKDFGASGLRCGVLFSENAEVLRAVDQLAYWAACSGHTQHLLAQLVADTDSVDPWIDRMRAGLREACAHVMTRLDALGIPYLPAEAGFFVVCDLRGFLAAPTWDAEHALWRRLVDEANVNLTPGGACRIVEPGFFRLCYAAVPADAIDVAFDRIGAMLHRTG